MEKMGRRLWLASVAHYMGCTTSKQSVEQAGSSAHEAGNMAAGISGWRTFNFLLVTFFNT